MSLKTNCLIINSYCQAVEIVKICKKNNIVPILFIKYYLINGLGIDWRYELIKMLQKEFKSEDFKIYVETKKNYGLFIALVEKKINFVNVQANHETMKRLKQIAKLNKKKYMIVDTNKNIEENKLKILNKVKKIVK